MNALDLTTLTLATGSHAASSGEMCLLEAAAFQAGEPWSDRPACVSTVLAIYGRNLNDVLPDTTRQRLIPFIPRLLNTAGDGLDEQRSYMALDWLARTYLPTWLRLVPALAAQADLLTAANKVVDLDTAAAVGVLVREAASQAAAGRDATWATDRAVADAAADAAWGAAGDAAWNAAWTAARYATCAIYRDAAWNAAWDAAWAAAKDAAWNAAKTALAPTVTVLQDSAIDLFDQMLSVTK